MNEKTWILALAFLATTGCSSNSDTDSSLVETGDVAFPALPTNSSEQVLVEGAMNNWFYEGDAGCYGTLKRGSSEIEVWIDADGCGEREYDEGARAAVVVTYRESEQWMPGKKSYTIVEFQ